jgi:hypothetical protein
MPQKVIRKVNLNVSSLITNTIGSGGELFQDFIFGTIFNLANHIVENNLNGNQGSPFPNKIESLFDSANNTQVRVVGSVNDGGVSIGGDFDNDNNLVGISRAGFLIFDLGKKTNPRKFQLTLDGQTEFLSEDITPGADGFNKGVRLKFTNDLTNFAGGVSTSFKDNDNFTTVTVAAGVAPHTEISTGGVTSTKGDTSSFTQRVLTLNENFFKTDYDGFQFLIVEFRGSRYSFTFDIFDLSLFEEVDPTDYSVEFDDSLLDLAGWKNSRYDGSKLTGQKINEFNRGDITYGKNPVVENKTNALYIVDTCIGAENEDEQFAFIAGHSYLTIKQILLINEKDDEVQLISKDSENLIKDFY